MLLNAKERLLMRSIRDTAVVGTRDNQAALTATLGLLDADRFGVVQGLSRPYRSVYSSPYSAEAYCSASAAC
jgi:hypothetical protein